MDFSEMSKRALEIRARYSEFEIKKFGREWTREEIFQGLVGDMGDLAKLVLAKSNVREIENADEKIAHELSDCLWSLIVLAQKYDIDLEKSFVGTMDDLEKRLNES